MRFSTLAAGAAVAGFAAAQNATTMSICDKYTTALLKNNTAANQYALLTLLVNTVGLGNFTGPGTTNPKLPGSMVMVPGILAPGMYNGEEVNLLPYFDGSLKSSNRNGTAVAINFLDGGGAAPIIADPFSSGDPNSRQYKLFTHLYQYFGALLGCSGYGTAGFPAYMGVQSQQSVHMFMDLDTAENSYFIEQVGLAAASFGVSSDDVMTVATTLNQTFGYRCAPAVAIKAISPEPYYESICQNVTCPVAPNGDCGTAPAPVLPAVASTAMMMSSSSMSMSPAMSSAAAAPMSSMSSAATGLMATGTGSAMSSMATGASATMMPGVAPYNGSASGLVAPGIIAGLAGLVAFAL